MSQEPQNDTADAASQSHKDLLAMVYEELRSLAAVRMAAQTPGHTLQPTALVHEAWLKLNKMDDRRWNNREHFFRSAAIAMRQILVDHARAKARHKRRHERCADAGDEVAETSSDHDLDSDILLIHECLGDLEKSDAECAKLVQLKFFAGLTNQEAADVLEVSLSSVDRLWAFARSKLFHMVRSRREAEMQ